MAEPRWATVAADDPAAEDRPATGEVLAACPVVVAAALVREVLATVFAATAEARAHAKQVPVA